jgi:hypothetical protein
VGCVVNEAANVHVTLVNTPEHLPESLIQRLSTSRVARADVQNSRNDRHELDSKEQHVVLVAIQAGAVVANTKRAAAALQVLFQVLWHEARGE